LVVETPHALKNVCMLQAAEAFGFSSKPAKRVAGQQSRQYALFSV